LKYENEKKLKKQKKKKKKKNVTVLIKNNMWREEQWFSFLN
jgi:hypothetical protein